MASPPMQQLRSIGTVNPPASLLAGQFAYNRETAAGAGPGPDDLYIGDGSAVHMLVGAARQVEIGGAQNITGAKTFTGGLTADVAVTHIGGGAAGSVLTTDGAGDLSWVLAPPATVITADPVIGDGTAGAPVTLDLSLNASLSGDGSAASPLAVVCATNAQIVAGTDSVNPICSAGLTSVLGDLTTLPPGSTIIDQIDDVTNTAGTALQAVTTNTSLTGDGTAATPLAVACADSATINGGTDNIQAICSAGLRGVTGDVTTINTVLGTTGLTDLMGGLNAVNQRVVALEGPLRLVGQYDAVAHEISAVQAGGPAAVGPVPPADPSNEGWVLVVSVAGTGAAPVPAVAMSVGDWVYSDGSSWQWLDLNAPSTVAANVAMTTLGAGWTATNVQDGMQELFDDKLSTIYVDGVTITGLTGPTDAGLTAANALTIGVIDSGTY